MSAEEDYKAWHDKSLEEDFQELMKSPFENLRSNYYDRKHSREDAVILQKMIEERLGVTDPEGELPEEAWRQSNWCSG